MKTFEYEILTGKPTRDQLNELGKQGWELTFMREDSFFGMVSYFKREKR